MSAGVVTVTISSGEGHGYINGDRVKVTVTRMSGVTAFDEKVFITKISSTANEITTSIQ